MQFSDLMFARSSRRVLATINDAVGRAIDRIELFLTQRESHTALVLAAFTLAMFANVLLWPGEQVLSDPKQDLAGEFVYWRQFGFAQLLSGHLPLWNPHVFSGVPFLGGFQAALLYPPNLIYLILPLAKAINLEIALHVFLLGWFTSRWIRRYGFHPAAVLLASTATMFGGAFFLHVYPGHLATLDAMAWVPLILLCIDELLADPQPEWILVGIFAFAMELMAGHPQTLFNTLVTCLLYGALQLRSIPRWRWTMLALATVGIGAIAITAMQLWTGMNAAGEGTRQGGVPYDFAAMLSFSPQNFLTLIVPGFFGNLTGFPYWGNGYLWEMCPFIGVTSLSLAGFGLFTDFSKKFTCLAMVLILFWIALAVNTPLFPILYNYAPGFDHFRCHAKFIFEASLFLALLAAAGMDQLTRSERAVRSFAIAMLCVGAIAAFVGIGLAYGGPFASLFKSWRESIGSMATIKFVAHHEASVAYLAEHGNRPSGLAQAGPKYSGWQCLLAAATFLGMGALLWLRRNRPRIAYLMVLGGLFEMFVFAHSTLTSFPLTDTMPTLTQEFLEAHPGDYRILHLPVGSQANSAMVIGAYDIWGYDPMVLKRYAQFIGYSQGIAPDDANMYVNFSNVGSPLGLARLRYVIRGKKKAHGDDRAAPLAHLVLLNQYSRIANRDEALKLLYSPGFDPLKTVVLESDPDPMPQAGDASGEAKIIASSPGELVISADITTPAILLITDAYSRYWYASALAGSSQASYAVLPANYAFMAIPLSAGAHRIRMTYAPPGYTIGRWVSITALLAYLLAIAIFAGIRLPVANLNAIMRRGTRGGPRLV